MAAGRPRHSRETLHSRMPKLIHAPSLCSTLPFEYVAGSERSDSAGNHVKYPSVLVDSGADFNLGRAELLQNVGRPPYAYYMFAPAWANHAVPTCTFNIDPSMAWFLPTSPVASRLSRSRGNGKLYVS